MLGPSLSDDCLGACGGALPVLLAARETTPEAVRGRRATARAAEPSKAVPVAVGAPEGLDGLVEARGVVESAGGADGLRVGELSEHLERQIPHGRVHASVGFVRGLAFASPGPFMWSSWGRDRLGTVACEWQGPEA